MATNLATLTERTLAGRPRNPFVTKSHWLLAGADAPSKTKSGLDQVSDTTLALFKAYSIRFPWVDLEPTLGAMDLSPIRRSLAYCAERGIGLFPMLTTRSFSGTAPVMPADLVADYEINHPSGAGNGRTACLYPDVPAARYEALIKTVIDEFGDDPNFLGVATTETSGQNSCAAETYSKAKWEAALHACYGNVAAYAPHLGVIAYWNFIQGSGTLSAAKASFDNVFADLPENVFPVTPDILGPGAPNHNSLNDRVYPLFTPNYGSTGVVCNVQNHLLGSSMQYDSFDLTQNGGLDMHELFIWGRDNLELDFVIWTNTTRTSPLTFDHVTSGNTVGHAVGVCMKDWDDAYDANYASP